MIPYGRQDITQADIDAVVEVLRSDFLTQGPMVPRFERTVAEYCDAAHAIASNSATSSLHLACLALDVGPGDIVWTSPITFVASANCALYCGATVEFVDIDPRTYNLSTECLERKLVQAEREKRLPKAIIVVHLCGQSCDMRTISDLRRRYGFRIVEDASHAIGGQYLGRPIGSCIYSDITVFSFHPVKVITTGEGGMAVTNDAGLATRMAELRTHGITRDPVRMSEAPDGDWYYEQISLGYNYRMTDIQAALGISQIARLDQYVQRRHDLAARYGELLADLPLILPWQSPDAHSALHLYVARIQLDRVKPTRREVFDAMRARGIGVNVHYIPVYRHAYHRAQRRGPSDFPNSDAYYREAITLPLHPRLSEIEQDQVADALREAVQA